MPEGVVPQMASPPSSNPIVGLVTALILIIVPILLIRRASKKRPHFISCPICKENIQFRLGFQAGMSGHFKAVHPEYWRLLRKWVAINTVVILTAIISIFPLLYYNIIPARPSATALTPIGIAIWAALTFSILGAGIFHQTRLRHRFKEQWSEKHPLSQRTYGNLRGVEVQLRDIHGKTRAALLSGIEFLFNPVAPLAVHITNVFLAKKAGKTRLDRYENGRLWFYNGFDMLLSVDLKNIPPVIVDEQRIRIALKRGQLELKTDNSADLNLILTVLRPAQSQIVGSPFNS